MEPIFVLKPYVLCDRRNIFSCWECCSGFAWLQLEWVPYGNQGGQWEGKENTQRATTEHGQSLQREKRICKLRSHLSPGWLSGKLLYSGLHSSPPIPRESHLLLISLIAFQFFKAKFCLSLKHCFFTVNPQGIPCLPTFLWNPGLFFLVFFLNSSFWCPHGATWKTIREPLFLMGLLFIYLTMSLWFLVPGLRREPHSTPSRVC